MVDKTEVFGDASILARCSVRGWSPSEEGLAATASNSSNCAACSPWWLVSFRWTVPVKDSQAGVGSSLRLFSSGRRQMPKMSQQATVVFTLYAPRRFCYHPACHSWVAPMNGKQNDIGSSSRLSTFGRNHIPTNFVVNLRSIDRSRVASRIRFVWCY